MNRLSNQRSEKIKQYRQRSYEQLNSSNGEMNSEYLNYNSHLNKSKESKFQYDVNAQILNEGLLQNIINEELNNMPDISVDEWNKEY